MLAALIDASVGPPVVVGRVGGWSSCQWLVPGEPEDRLDLFVSKSGLTRLVGYDCIAALKECLLSEEQFARKYGSGERHYVIRARGGT